MCEFNENLFEKMLDDYLPEEKKTGDVIEGIITRKEVDYSYLDLNGKKEGRIISREVEDFNIGDRIEVKVLRNEEDIVIVSKFLLDKSKEFFSLSVDEIVTGKIVKKIKGGYSVKIGKNDGFLPFSLSNFHKDKEYTPTFFYKKNKPGSYTLKLEFNMLSNTNNSAEFEEVLENSSGKLFTLRPTNPAAGIGFGFKYISTMGNSRVRVDSLFHYILPFKKGW